MTTPKKTLKTAQSNRAPKDRPAAKSTKKSRRSATKKGAEHAIRPGTKQADLIALLQRREGVTVAQMCAKIGWQSHSVRAALTGLRKRGLSINRETNDAGTTVYRTVPQRRGFSS